MALKRKTAASILPVTLPEMKAQVAAQDFSDDDAYLQRLIEAATSHLDGYHGVLGRCMISQEWELYYDAFPCGPLRLPIGPLIAVNEVAYVDPVSALYVAWDVANYEVDDKSHDGWVVPVGDWPVPMETVNAVRVTFTAGFGANPSDVPASLRQAILMLAGHWYRNREAVMIGETAILLPLAVDALVGPYRHMSI